jgi:hypothetical protein
MLSIFLNGLTPLDSSAQVKKKEPVDWRENLYAQNVSYSDFSCRKEDASIVRTFFVTRPLNPRIPICHNDCPIIQCRPVVRFPAAAKAIRVTGIVSVHVLVDETGAVLYARALSGHLFLLDTARKAACDTKFLSGASKRQGVMHFTVENYEYLGVPYRANQVW